MRFDVITLFPELIAPYLETGVTRRAYASGQMQVRLWQLRDFAEGHYRRVDDRPFGGGPGMVMQAEPLAKCLAAIWQERGVDPATSAALPPVVLFSPVGRTLRHSAVQQWADGEGAVLVCGRYEGVDQRFIDASVTHQISLGDFVLSGGEIAAVALLDAVARLQPGVLHDEASHVEDSFNPALDGLLDCPHYTRPEEWQGRRVPDVLLGGNHAAIARWRRAQSVSLTHMHRPDLLQEASRLPTWSAADERQLEALHRPPRDTSGN